MTHCLGIFKSQSSQENQEKNARFTEHEKTAPRTGDSVEKRSYQLHLAFLQPREA